MASDVNETIQNIVIGATLGQSTADLAFAWKTNAGIQKGGVRNAVTINQLFARMSADDQQEFVTYLFRKMARIDLGIDQT